LKNPQLLPDPVAARFLERLRFSFIRVQTDVVGQPVDARE
jgi:hypothetical protein